MKPEHALELYLQREAKKQDVLCYKFTSPAQNGVPDRILMANGHIRFVELKAPGEQPRPLQISVINRMRKHGAVVHITDSRAEIRKILCEIVDTPGPIKDTAPLIKRLDKMQRDKRTEPTSRPEHKIETYFKKIAKAAGALTFKFTSPSRTGVPDQILIHNGQVVFVELKAPGKKPRPQQQLIFDIMAAHGARPVVIDSYEKAGMLLSYISKPEGKG